MFYVVRRSGQTSTSETWLLSNTLCNHTFFDELEQANGFATQCCLEAAEGEFYSIHKLDEIMYEKEFVRCLEMLLHFYPNEGTLEKRINLYMTYKPNLGDYYDGAG